MGLQISIREFGDVNIVDLLGRSTSGESEPLRGNLRDLIAAGKRKLLLNLTNVTQLDTSGVGVIVQTYVSLRRRDGDLKLLGVGGQVLEVLTLAALLEVIPNFENEPDAVESFGPRGYFAASGV